MDPVTGVADSGSAPRARAVGRTGSRGPPASRPACALFA